MKDEQNSLDIRILKLARWHVPKEETVFADGEGSSCLTIGYFDLIDVKQVSVLQNEKSPHPLSVSYGMLDRVVNKSNMYKNYSIQEMIVFANRDANTRDKINAFWEEDSLITFVSLIHIDNDSDIHKIVNKIENVFEGMKYLYYFSFDYSGIILFAKQTSIKNYLEKVFKLNFQNAGEEKYIRDSYSFYGFNKKILKKYFDKIDANCTSMEEVFEGLNYSNEKYSVSVNIGVQNYNTYKLFIQELQRISNNTVKEFSVYGRHDISLVKEDADLRWLIYVQYLLNVFSSVDEEKESLNSREKLFSTHETFVKVKMENQHFIDVPTKCNSCYKSAREQLDSLCDLFSDSINEDADGYNGAYKAPVLAVKHSVLGILRNGFAEDFVLCMYQSFCDFLQYVISQNKIQKNQAGLDTQKNEFEQCFEQYFYGLNSLVNSAMHSERQFVQATAFNAIIYDIPSKIMAFYVALIHRIQMVIRGSADKKYTFLLTPSFHNEIAVSVISYYPEATGEPGDRILMVKINEHSLYDPKCVIQRIAHEIGHYVGDDLRRRDKRKAHIELSMIYVILSKILHKLFLEYDDYKNLPKKIFKELPCDIRFSVEANNYSRNLRNIFKELPREMVQNEKLHSILEQYVKKVLCEYLCKDNSQKDEMKQLIRHMGNKMCGGEDEFTSGLLEQDNYRDETIDYFVRVIMEDMDCELKYLYTDNPSSILRVANRSIISQISEDCLEQMTLEECGSAMLSAYSEAFSDLQMIFVTGIEYLEYVTGFFVKEKLTKEQFVNRINVLMRISMVTFVMNAIGMWKDLSLDAEHQYSGLEDFHNCILQQVFMVRNQMDESVYESIYRPLRDLAKKFNEQVKKRTMEDEEMVGVWYSVEKNAKADKLLSIVNMQLAMYLEKCAEMSLKHYCQNEKAAEIKQLRKAIQNVEDFSDVEEVFCGICGELQSYKNYLWGDT